MASRPLLTTLLTSTTRSQLPIMSLRALTASTRPLHRQLHTTPTFYRPSNTTGSSLSDSVAATNAQPSPVQNTTATPFTTTAEPLPPDSDSPDARHASFLGEADSNDGHETNLDMAGRPEPSLDAENSAFLGEADSDDGFEVRKDIDGEKLEAVDASNSAYLGEADSDDGFEADVVVNPDRHDHKLQDVGASGLHGQTGEQDEPIERNK